MTSFKQLGPSFRPTSLFKPPQVTGSKKLPLAATAATSSASRAMEYAVSQDRVDQLIRAYPRSRTLVAQIDHLACRGQRYRNWSLVTTA